MPTEDPETPRIARACLNCNKKKIRCRFGHHQHTCDSCAIIGIECIARTRKKRKIALRHGSPTSGTPYGYSEFRPPLPHQYWGPGSSSWPGDSEGLAFARQSPSRIKDRGTYSNSRGSSQTKQLCENAFPGRLTTPLLRNEQSVMASSTYPETTRDITNSAHLHHESPQDHIRSQGEATAEKEDDAGKPEYIPNSCQSDEIGQASYKQMKGTELLDIEFKTLELYGSLELPQRAARHSLIDTYMQKCYPWTPVIGPEELDNCKEKPPSLLLSQSIFLAASNVSSTSGITTCASARQFYQRTKALFWTGYECDPFTIIKSALNMYWYNSDGQERFSFDSGTFWLQTAVGLAHQVGLHKEPVRGNNQRSRRKLWWSLVVRDCLVAIEHGRPRSINFKDCDINPPCLEDFPGETVQGELFISYVEINILLAELAECLMRKHMADKKLLHIERGLFRWSRTLPPHLQFSKREVSGQYTLASYDIKARQLHVPYFTTMVMLGQSDTTNRNVSSLSVLAASFVAGISEDFLNRDELSSLGPIFTFYLLAAGISLSAVRHYQNLWPHAEQDLEIIKICLIELSKPWPSAIRALKALENIAKTSLSNQHNITTLPPPITRLTADQSLLFDGFCPDLCRLWVPYQKETSLNRVQQLVTNDENPEIITAEILGSLRYPGAARPSQVATPMMEHNNPNHDPSSLAHDTVGVGVGEWLVKYWDSGLST